MLRDSHFIPKAKTPSMCGESVRWNALRGFYTATCYLLINDATACKLITAVTFSRPWRHVS